MELLFPLLIAAAMYFLLIRPQQKRTKAQRELLSSLEVGDKIVTVGGIVGEIVKLGDREMTVRTEPGTQLTMVRGAIGSRIPPEGAPEITAGDSGSATTGDPGTPIS